MIALLHASFWRRWMRFRLRTLMLTITLLAVVLWQVKRAREQREAVNYIKAMGGTVYYDWQQFAELPDGSRQPLPGEPDAPAWLRKVLGDELFQEVVEVEVHGSFGGPCRGVIPVVGQRETPVESQALTFAEFVSGGKHGELAGVPLVRVQFGGRVSKEMQQAWRAEKAKEQESTKQLMWHIGRLSRLRRLLMDRFGFPDENLAYLANLTDLQTLEIDSYGIFGDGLVHLEKMQKLRSLNLSQTQVGDAGLPAIGCLKNLVHLNLSQTRITGQRLVCLRGLDQLRELILDGNYLEFVDLAGIDDTSPPWLPKNLEKLSLSHSHIRCSTGAFNFYWLQSASKLKTFEMSGCYEWSPDDGNQGGVVFSSLEPLGRLPNLESLNLGFSYIGDEDIAELLGEGEHVEIQAPLLATTRMPKLCELKLHETKVSPDAVLRLKARFPRLELGDFQGHDENEKNWNPFDPFTPGPIPVSSTPTPAVPGNDPFGS